MDEVILVDESATLTAADVERERAAASLLAQAPFAPASRISVYGFGSANGPGQHAVHQVCPPTRDRGLLARCTASTGPEGIHLRAVTEGQDTDHYAALRQAAETLAMPGGNSGTKVVFLLTDGVLDVHDSPAYDVAEQCESAPSSAPAVHPPGPDRRTAEADRRIRECVLPVLRNRERAQIWPLGFGRLARLGQLQPFADGGAGPNPRCDRLGSARPAAKIVRSSDDVLATLKDVLASAQCAQASDIDTAALPPSVPVELHVPIPSTATDGAITVWKGLGSPSSVASSRVQVTYRAPNGVEIPESVLKTGGTFDGSRFERSGDDTPTETVRIVDPRPGEWTVVLRAPPDAPQAVAGALVVWAGTLRGVVEIDPSPPVAGGTVSVRVRLRTRQGADVCGADLAHLSITAEVRVTGMEPATVGLTGLCRPSHPQAGDATAIGTVQIPRSASGDLTIAASVQADGVTGQVDPLRVRVRPAPAGKSPGPGPESFWSWPPAGWHRARLIAIGAIPLAVLLLLLLLVRRWIARRAPRYLLVILVGGGRRGPIRVPRSRRRYEFHLENLESPYPIFGPGSGRGKRADDTRCTVRWGPGGLIMVTLPGEPTRPAGLGQPILLGGGGELLLDRGH